MRREFAEKFARIEAEYARAMLIGKPGHGIDHRDGISSISSRGSTWLCTSMRLTLPVMDIPGSKDWGLRKETKHCGFISASLRDIGEVPAKVRFAEFFAR